MAKLHTAIAIERLCHLIVSFIGRQFFLSWEDIFINNAMCFRDKIIQMNEVRRYGGIEEAGGGMEEA